jgi:DUF4097 and DUF4098 domain-containing protein YvlB
MHRAKTSLALLCFFWLAISLRAGEIKETFKDVKEIKIKTVSGDCIIEKGTSSEVTVVVNYTYEDEDFEPELQQRGDRLHLTENFGRGSFRGDSIWRITAPEKTNIDFSTASGNIEVSDLSSTVEASTASGNLRLRNLNGEAQVSTASGEIDATKLVGKINVSTASGDVTIAGFSGQSKLNTASGSITASEVKGELKLNTASGRIRLTNASGELDVNTASGDINAEGITLEQVSSFNAASGDVDVTLAASPMHDLSVSTASGDATLNFNNQAIKGLVKMTAKVRRGSISAPFEFDSEDIHYRGGDDDEYVTKTAKRGGADTPLIEISTASGRAALRER